MRNTRGMNCCYTGCKATAVYMVAAFWSKKWRAPKPMCADHYNLFASDVYSGHASGVREVRAQAIA